MAKRSTAAAAVIDEDAPQILSPAPSPPKKAERNLAGKYRVIHGNVWVARPHAATHNADGSRKEHEPPQEAAKPGAIVYLPHEDAKLALLAGLVEEPDASPTRVGRVYEPNEPHDNSKQAKARIAQNLHPLVRGMQPDV